MSDQIKNPLSSVLYKLFNIFLYFLHHQRVKFILSRSQHGVYVVECGVKSYQAPRYTCKKTFVIQYAFDDSHRATLVPYLIPRTEQLPLLPGRTMVANIFRLAYKPAPESICDWKQSTPVWRVFGILCSTYRGTLLRRAREEAMWFYGGKIHFLTKKTYTNFLRKRSMLLKLTGSKLPDLWIQRNSCFGSTLCFSLYAFPISARSAELWCYSY